MYFDKSFFPSNYGIFIDIFPFDSISDGIDPQFDYLKKSFKEQLQIFQQFKVLSDHMTPSTLQLPAEILFHQYPNIADPAEIVETLSDPQYMDYFYNPAHAPS